MSEQVLGEEFMKRIILFIATNLAVMLVLSIVLSLLGIGRPGAGGQLQMGSLLAFSLVVGFTGSIISLLMSKPMAKWSTGARVIDAPANSTEQWLVNTVAQLAQRAGIGMPEVAVYEGEPNAFATGAFKNSALVAVSTGLLQSMNRDEVEAVLGHEVAHIANGDMVTLTLIQGVVNTFVVFLARVVGFFVDNMLRSKDDQRSSGSGIGYMVTVFVCEIVFGLLASIIVAWFSRQREFRADAGSAKLLGSSVPMQHALARLGGLEPGPLPQNMAASGINNSGGWTSLFSTHPPMEERIAALRLLR
jgi:heat shock protein HtpX